jgi:hypothetical protein
MLLNRKTISVFRHSGDPTCTIVKNTVRFSAKAQEMFKTNGRLQVQFKFENRQLIVIVGQHPDAFLVYVNPKSSLCCFDSRHLTAKIREVMQVKEDERLVFRVGSAIELRHEGNLQFPLTKM